jgi:hypothetical protein
MNRVVFVAVVSVQLFFMSLAGIADSVAFPAGDAAWTVSFAPSSAPARNAGVSSKAPSQVEVTQIKKIRRVLITWNDGSTTQQWAIPPLPVNFEEDPRTGAIDPNQSGSSSEGAIKFTCPYDLSAFSWVSPSTLKEKDPVDYEGKRCFHYRGQDQAYPGGPVEMREAWIDSVTLQPIALQAGNILATFTFAKKPPVGPLDIPPKFKKEIDYYKVVMGYHNTP